METGSTIFANHKDFGGNFDKEFARNLERYDSLEIASGYFGVSKVSSLQSKLLQIARRGHCKILIGMIFNEGVSQTQKDKLLSLDDELKNINNQSGVFVTLKQYHGKIYKFNKHQETRIYVGSSNFSFSGFETNYEFNTLVTDAQTQSQVTRFLDYLWSDQCDFTVPLIDVELVVKGRSGLAHSVMPSQSLGTCEIPPEQYPTAPPISEMNIVLRVDDQPSSSLNLYFDKGRKNKDGKYVPRPWYEVEITTTVQDRNHPDYPIGEFDAFIQSGKKYYKVPMITASDNHKAMTSRGDRTILGEFIKGTLQAKGCLSPGERITSDTLNDYGRNYIVLKKIDQKKFVLEF